MAFPRTILDRLPFRSRTWLLEPWRSRVLYASLALNLFAAAHVATILLAPHRPAGPNFDSVVERLARPLAQPEAAAFREIMARERPWYELGRTNIEQSRLQVAIRIRAEPFDPLALRLELLRMQDRLRETASRFDDSLVMALATMPPEARVAMADAVRRPPGRRGGEGPR